MHLLSIENESRKLLKTRYYKGTPFYGSWDVRNAIKDRFNETLEYVAEKNELGFLKWEFNQNAELPFDKMEARQSVHIAPKHYMFNAKTELF